MDRTQKKCFVASICMHIVLLAAVIFLPAFMTPPELPKPNIVLMSSPAVGDILKSGRPGNPGAPAPRPAAKSNPAPAPAPAPRSEPKQAPAPEPQPRQESRPEPAPQKAAPKMAKADIKRSEIPTPKTTPTKRETSVKVNIDDVVVKGGTTKTRSTSKQKSDSKSRETSSSNETAANDARERSKQFGQSLSRLNQGLSNGVEIEMPDGQNGDGAAGFFDYGAMIKERYDMAWMGTEDISDDSSVVRVSVTVSRDGRIRSAKIIKSSRNPALNSSVQRALDAVRVVAPFPADLKVEQHTFEFNFNLKSRRSG